MDLSDPSVGYGVTEELIGTVEIDGGNKWVGYSSVTTAEETMHSNSEVTTILPCFQIKWQQALSFNVNY